MSDTMQSLEQLSSL
jgi:small subunit ribosomal protein S9